MYLDNNLGSRLDLCVCVFFSLRYIYDEISAIFLFQFFTVIPNVKAANFDLGFTIHNFLFYNNVNSIQ